MKIYLDQFAGEYCTRRTSPALIELRALLKKHIEEKKKLEIDVSKVKILTPSFIDELIPPLIIEYGEKEVDRFISFTPPLQGFLKEQVSRGTRLREQKLNSSE